jgi:hypothetical protein
MERSARNESGVIAVQWCASEKRAIMSKRLDLQHGRDIRADLVCVLCGRTAGTVQGPNVPHVTSMSLRVQDPRHLDAVRRLRCPSCAGWLWLQNSEEVHIDRRPLTTEELRPRVGRRPTIRRPA